MNAVLLAIFTVVVGTATGIFSNIVANKIEPYMKSQTKVIIILFSVLVGASAAIGIASIKEPSSSASSNLPSDERTQSQTSGASDSSFQVQNRDGQVNISIPPVETPERSSSSEELQFFPDGVYLYGKDSGAPSIPGAEYISFQKEGQYIVGVGYEFRTGNSYCFQGTALDNSIVKVTSAILDDDPDASFTSWNYSSRERWSFLDDYSFPIAGGTSSVANKGLEECKLLFIP